MKKILYHPYNTRKKTKTIKAIQAIQKRIRGRLVRRKLFNLKKYNICSICLEKIKYIECSTLIPCNHIFHKRCLDTWTNKNCSCPNCRTPIHYLPKKSNLIDLMYRLLDWIRNSNP
jgi:hypothetical protein